MSTIDTYTPVQYYKPRTDTMSVADKIYNTYDNWADSHPWLATSAETVALVGVRLAIAKASYGSSLKIGNGHMPKHITFAAEHPTLALMTAVVVAPLVEETIYREALPKLTKKVAPTAPQPVIDHTIHTIFALRHSGLHAGNRESTPALPVPQYMGAMHYARLQKTRGLSHSIGAHVLNNAMYTALAIPDILKQRRS